MQSFKLIPYPAAHLPEIEISGSVECSNGSISLRFETKGDVGTILFPTPEMPAVRKHELWKATCFEFFLAPEGQSQYWEFNLSPSGHWNVYHMDAYRQVNMREENLFTHLPFHFEKTGKHAMLEIKASLNSILLTDTNIQLGVAAIIQLPNGEETYWALTHPGSQADFHLREGFVIQIKK